MTARLPDDFDERPDHAATRPGRVRRYTLIGLSAGLLGGAAVGLAATSPLSSQAAELPQLVAAPDPTDPADPADPADPEPGTDEALPASPAEHLREVLQPLVDDGTLTTEQLDAVVATLQGARPAFPRPGGHRGPGLGGPGRPGGEGRAHVLLDREELAAVLGLDADALGEQLRDGSSLAEIAERQGVDVEVVIDLLVADAEARIADRIDDGTLSEEQGADRAAELRERVTELVNRAPGEPPVRPADDVPAGDVPAEDAPATTVVG